MLDLNEERLKPELLDVTPDLGGSDVDEFIKDDDGSSSSDDEEVLLAKLQPPLAVRSKTVRGSAAGSFSTRPSGPTPRQGNVGGARLLGPAAGPPPSASLQPGDFNNIVQQQRPQTAAGHQVTTRGILVRKDAASYPSGSSPHRKRAITWDDRDLERERAAGASTSREDVPKPSAKSSAARKDDRCDGEAEGRDRGDAVEQHQREAVAAAANKTTKFRVIPGYPRITADAVFKDNYAGSKPKEYSALKKQFEQRFAEALQQSKNMYRAAQMMNADVPVPHRSTPKTTDAGVAPTDHAGINQAKLSPRKIRSAGATRGGAGAGGASSKRPATSSGAAGRATVYKQAEAGDREDRNLVVRSEHVLARETSLEAGTTSTRPKSAMTPVDKNKTRSDVLTSLPAQDLRPRSAYPPRTPTSESKVQSIVIDDGLAVYQKNLVRPQQRPKPPQLHRSASALPVRSTPSPTKRVSEEESLKAAEEINLGSSTAPTAGQRERDAGDPAACRQRSGSASPSKRAANVTRPSSTAGSRRGSAASSTARSQSASSTRSSGRMSAAALRQQMLDQQAQNTAAMSAALHVPHYKDRETQEEFMKSMLPASSRLLQGTQASQRRKTATEKEQQEDHDTLATNKVGSSSGNNAAGVSSTTTTAVPRNVNIVANRQVFTAVDLQDRVEYTGHQSKTASQNALARPRPNTSSGCRSTEDRPASAINAIDTSNTVFVADDGVVISAAVSKPGALTRSSSCAAMRPSSSRTAPGMAAAAALSSSSRLPRPTSAGRPQSASYRAKAKQSFEVLELSLMNKHVSKGERMVLFLQKQECGLEKRVFVLDSSDEFIRKALLDRGNWVENKYVESGLWNLKWCATDSEEDYKNLDEENDLYNHFQHNRELTTKFGLARNLKNLSSDTAASGVLVDVDVAVVPAPVDSFLNKQTICSTTRSSSTACSSLVRERSGRDVFKQQVTCSIVDSFFPRCYDIALPESREDFIVEYCRNAAWCVAKKHLNLVSTTSSYPVSKYRPNLTVLRVAQRVLDLWVQEINAEKLLDCDVGSSCYTGSFSAGAAAQRRNSGWVSEEEEDVASGNLLEVHTGEDASTRCSRRSPSKSISANRPARSASRSASPEKGKAWNNTAPSSMKLQVQLRSATTVDEADFDALALYSELSEAQLCRDFSEHETSHFLKKRGGLLNLYANAQNKQVYSESVRNSSVAAKNDGPEQLETAGCGGGSSSSGGPPGNHNASSSNSGTSTASHSGMNSSNPLATRTSSNSVTGADAKQAEDWRRAVPKSLQSIEQWAEFSSHTWVNFTDYGTKHLQEAEHKHSSAEADNSSCSSASTTSNPFFLLNAEFQKFTAFLESHPLTKPQLSLCNAKQNCWIVKPGNNARGSGIVVLKNLKEILYQTNPSRLVMKYIEKPLTLFNGRKFDVRQWVLVKSFDPLEIWMFSQCYLRLCNEPYDLGDLENRQKHISNWEVNKHAKGKHAQEGAVASLETFKNELHEITGNPDYWEEAILPELRTIIVKTCESVKTVVKQRKSCFEVFGFDIMIDDKLKPWLLEVNLSPACDVRTPFLVSMVSDMSHSLFDVVLGSGKKIGNNAESCIADVMTSPRQFRERARAAKARADVKESREDQASGTSGYSKGEWWCICRSDNTWSSDDRKYLTTPRGRSFSSMSLSNSTALLQDNKDHVSQQQGASGSKAGDVTKLTILGQKVKWNREWKLEYCWLRLRAALLLQRVTRGMFARQQLRYYKRLKAVKVIQRNFRGFAGRKKFRREKQTSLLHTILIPKLKSFAYCVYLRNQKRLRLALVAQKLWRGRKTRIWFATWRLHEYAKRIQKFFRKRRRRRRISRKRRIQRFWRKQFRKRVNAANQIRKMFVGYKARKEFEKKFLPRYRALLFGFTFLPYLRRLRKQTLLVYQAICARKIQRFWRRKRRKENWKTMRFFFCEAWQAGYFAPVREAQIKLAAIQRGNQARKEFRRRLQKKREEDERRRRAEKRKLENSAAVKLQRSFRYYRRRKYGREFRREMQEERRSAATRIQAALYRGRKARKLFAHLKWLREQRREREKKQLEEATAKKKNTTALQIQSIWRGVTARKKRRVELKKKQEVEELKGASFSMDCRPTPDDSSTSISVSRGGAEGGSNEVPCFAAVSLASSPSQSPEDHDVPPQFCIDDENSSNSASVVFKADEAARENDMVVAATSTALASRTFAGAGNEDNAASVEKKYEEEVISSSSDRREQGHRIGRATPEDRNALSLSIIRRKSKQQGAAQKEPTVNKESESLTSGEVQAAHLSGADTTKADQLTVTSTTSSAAPLTQAKASSSSSPVYSFAAAANAASAVSSRTHMQLVDLVSFHNGTTTQQGASVGRNTTTTTKVGGATTAIASEHTAVLGKTTNAPNRTSASHSKTQLLRPHSGSQLPMAISGGSSSSSSSPSTSGTLPTTKIRPSAGGNATPPSASSSSSPPSAGVVPHAASGASPMESSSSSTASTSRAFRLLSANKQEARALDPAEVSSSGGTTAASATILPPGKKSKSSSSSTKLKKASTPDLLVLGGFSSSGGGGSSSSTTQSLAAATAPAARVVSEEPPARSMTVSAHGDKAAKNIKSLSKTKAQLLDLEERARPRSAQPPSNLMSGGGTTAAISSSTPKNNSLASNKSGLVLRPTPTLTHHAVHQEKEKPPAAPPRPPEKKKKKSRTTHSSSSSANTTAGAPQLPLGATTATPVAASQAGAFALCHTTHDPEKTKDGKSTAAVIVSPAPNKSGTLTASAVHAELNAREKKARRHETERSWSASVLSKIVQQQPQSQTDVGTKKSSAPTLVPLQKGSEDAHNYFVSNSSTRPSSSLSELIRAGEEVAVEDSCEDPSDSLFLQAPLAPRGGRSGSKSPRDLLHEGLRDLEMLLLNMGGGEGGDSKSRPDVTVGDRTRRSGEQAAAGLQGGEEQKKAPPNALMSGSNVRTIHKLRSMSTVEQKEAGVCEDASLKTKQALSPTNANAKGPAQLRAQVYRTRSLTADGMLVVPT
ncbi:unnamed protein product [Amoebophrya sp. A120]|nr:unnamed protein product [Amoebophrya sp. A120]|eukprot:GSA120T00004406001.1